MLAALPYSKSPCAAVIRPVPPLVTPIAVALHVPVVTVPRVVIDDCPTYPVSISITGVFPPVDVIRFDVPETLVTPVPAGVLQLPSPLQNVEALAEEPEFKCDTARFPVTSVLDKSTTSLYVINKLPIEYHYRIYF